MKGAARLSEEALVLDLPPLPEVVFADLLAFGGLGEEEKRAMRLEAERLLEGAAAFVAQVYDRLSRHPGTARALGWEGRVPEEELYLRRAFFSAWLARAIGVDTSKEFAREVYRAGLWHGGLGPKGASIPPRVRGPLLRGGGAVRGGEGAGRAPLARLPLGPGGGDAERV